MKIRENHVANSSSSSFVVRGLLLTKEEFEKNPDLWEQIEMDDKMY